MSGLHRVTNGGHWYTWNGSDPVPGCTSVIKVAKSAEPLVGWAKRETARCAVDNHDQIGAMIAQGGKAAAIDWLKRIPDFQRDSKGDTGTRVHAYAELRALGQEPPIPPDLEAYATTLERDFLGKVQPTFRLVEAMVWGGRYGGTLDAVAIIDGETWLLDYKTGKDVYEDAALQLAALSRAIFVGYPDDPRPYAIPPIDRYGIVHVTPERTRLVELDVTDREWDAFTACLDVWEWQQTRAREVIR